MLGERYVVQKGDNLWRIAARKLGHGREWPRIWRYNNRRQVIAVTGSSLPNPDHLRINQVLLLPILPSVAVPKIHTGENDSAAKDLPTASPQHAPKVASPETGNAPSLSKKLPSVRSPLAFKYKFDDLAWPPQDVGTAIVQMKMTGDLVLMTKRAYPIVNINQRRELEAQFVKSANHAMGKLVQDTRFIYDPTNKRVVARSMLVSQSRTPNFTAFAIGSEISSNSPLPKLRAEIRLPKLEGFYETFHYTAIDVKNRPGDHTQGAASARAERT
ncbi:MAG TPA: LysM domain-containing protein, partial [Polyangiales bacterium]|nr:LysM domain-containing protein [Polyangiales bacterium]